jgi:succinate dehydrogenase / fumarate reductase cytochrome b subunit
MKWLLEFYRSSLGKKAIMAVTGVLLFGFVLFHMLGNLKLFLGPEKINGYAEGLRLLGEPILSHGDLLWILRAGLLAAVVLHVVSAWQLRRLNARARPARYVKQSPQAATYASRSMFWGGVLIVLFVGYHLLHLTVGNVHGEFIPGDVHHNMVTAFQNPVITGLYSLTALALGFHLHHGLWSFFQSLGWTGPRLDTFRHRFAIVFAVVVAIGFMTVPAAILIGFVS